MRNVKLNDPAVFESLKKWVQDAITFNKMKDAFWFANIMESALAEQRGVVFPGSEMARKYEELIARARWVAIPLLSDNEIVSLFEKSLRVILFDADYDLWEVLSTKLVALLMLEDRDALKQKIVYSLLKNQEIIISNNFQLEGKTVPATVENWMREYVRFVGNGSLDKLKQAQYLVESKNFTGLDAQERAGILKLIHFYERCRLSSLTLQGLEDVIPVPAEIGEGGRSGVIREGRFEPDDSAFIADYEQQLEAVNAVMNKKEKPEVVVSEQKIEEVSKEVVLTTTPSLSQNLKAVGDKIDHTTTPFPSLNKEGKELTKPFDKEGKSEQKFLPKEDTVLIPAPEILHENHPLRVELEELVEQVMREIEGIGDRVAGIVDPILQKRFRVIVSARLRGVRDGMETRDMLLRPVKIGGLGLKISGGSTSGAMEVEPRVVDVVMGIIEKAFGEFEKKWRAIEEQRVEEWKKKQRVEKEEREKLAVEKEAREVEERYRRLTGGIPNFQLPISNKSPKPKVQIEAKPLPIPPLPIPPSPPYLPKSIPKLTPPSPPLSKGGKEMGQKFTDVRTVPRLVGHIEELSSLTLQDFKRLAPNAQEATAKILSKIEFLSKESFGQRTQALVAWRKSPLNQFYTMISEQAMLKRVPPQTLLTELSQQGKPTITVEEFYAIMELNQKLRF